MAPHDGRRRTASGPLPSRSSTPVSCHAPSHTVAQHVAARGIFPAPPRRRPTRRVGAGHREHRRAAGRADGARALSGLGRVRHPGARHLEGAGRGDRDRPQRLGDLRSRLRRAGARQARARHRAHRVRHRLVVQGLHRRGRGDAGRRQEGLARREGITVPARLPARRPVRVARADRARPAQPSQRPRARRADVVRLRLRPRRDRAPRALPPADVELPLAVRLPEHHVHRRRPGRRSCRQHDLGRLRPRPDPDPARHDVEHDLHSAAHRPPGSLHASLRDGRGGEAAGGMAEHRQRRSRGLHQFHRARHGALGADAARQGQLRGQAADQREDDRRDAYAAYRHPDRHRRRAAPTRTPISRPTGSAGSSRTTAAAWSCSMAGTSTA